MKQGQGRFRGAIVSWLLAPPLLVAFAIAMWWLDRWSLGIAFDAYLVWQRVLANAAVGLVAMLLLAALTRRLLLSILCVAGVQSLVYVASSIKIGLLDVPVVVQDVYFLTGLDVAGIQLLSEYVDVSWKTGLGVAGGVLVVGLLFWLERPWCRPLGVARIAALAVSVGLMVALYVAAWPWTVVWYGRPQIRPSPLSQMPAALHGGLVASMVHYHGVQRHRMFTVDAPALRAALRAVAGDAAPKSVAPAPDQRPDVVIVLSESFMDPRVLKGMQDVPDVIPAIRAQVEAGHGGWMRAPTFGGGTVRTEFEVLTGMPVAAFPGVQYPYVNLNPRFLPGVVSALERHGYASVALHGNSGAFWNRANTYEAMGVDTFLTQRSLFKAGARRDGAWLSDRSMTDILLAELERATKPTVAIAISIQNHGPYDTDAEVLAPEERKAIQLPAGLDGAGAREFRNYLYNLHRADGEFARLLAALQARKRPFVLLFFGDHLPALGEAYDKLGFVDGREPQAQYVPWVLVANTGLAPPAAAGKPVYAWQLPALALRAAGMGGDAWFDFSGSVGQRMNPAGPAEDPVLLKGLHAGAIARLQNRFEDYAGHE